MFPFNKFYVIALWRALISLHIYFICKWVDTWVKVQDWLMVAKTRLAKWCEIFSNPLVEQSYRRWPSESEVGELQSARVSGLPLSAMLPRRHRSMLLSCDGVARFALVCSFVRFGMSYPVVRPLMALAVGFSPLTVRWLSSLSVCLLHAVKLLHWLAAAQPIC